MQHTPFSPSIHQANPNSSAHLAHNRLVRPYPKQGCRAARPQVYGIVQLSRAIRFSVDSPPESATSTVPLHDTGLIGRLHRHFSDARKAVREATVIIVQRPFNDEDTLLVDGKLCGDTVTPSTLGKTLEEALPLVWPRKP